MYLTMLALFCIYLVFYICKKEFFSSHERIENNSASSVKYNIKELSCAFNVGLKSLEDTLKTKRLSVVKMYNVNATHSLFKFKFQLYNFETTNISDWNLEVQRPVLKNGTYKTTIIEKIEKVELSEEQTKLNTMGISTLENNATYFHF